MEKWSLSEGIKGLAGPAAYVSAWQQEENPVDDLLQENFGPRRLRSVLDNLVKLAAVDKECCGRDFVLVGCLESNSGCMWCTKADGDQAVTSRL